MRCQQTQKPLNGASHYAARQGFLALNNFMKGHVQCTSLRSWGRGFPSFTVSPVTLSISFCGKSSCGLYSVQQERRYDAASSVGIDNMPDASPVSAAMPHCS